MKKKILVVDDNADILELISLALDGAFEVVTCRSSSDAVDWIWQNAEKPDLILTDLDMPALNGLQVIEQAKQHYGKVKVILMSGGFQSHSEEECRKTVQNILMKPFEIPKLFAMIRSVISEDNHEHAMVA